jgi:ribulose-5-phosphate 4-epimerase/fuculose-1-phosphate aldolase
MALRAIDFQGDRDAERRARIDLAAVHRLAHRFRWNDNIYNHLTYAVPGHPDRFLVKAHGFLMSEITASNLIVVDTEGNTLSGEGEVETTALHIHAAIHLRVPHASCVLHLHPPYSTWLTCLENNRLGMVNQGCLRYYDRIAYDDEYAGLATAREEGERMARVIGNQRVVMHANHGITTVAPTVAEAFTDLFFLESCCEDYHRVVSSGATPRLVANDLAQRTSEEMADMSETDAALTFAAWKRVLDREEPDYAH